MESIYYVLCWHCHRRCKHCYEDRFRPYVREELDSVVAEAERNAPRIIAKLPDSMSYLDRSCIAGNSAQDFARRTGRIILSGGDVLTDPVRERVLYPSLEAIRDKYRDQGGVKVVVQTTGDLLTPVIINELLARDVWCISVSGLDDYHVGMEGQKKNSLIAKLKTMFADAGVLSAEDDLERRGQDKSAGPVYGMFGANEDTWIGKLWPRGRAWDNNLSTATLADNFCNAWSGGLNFMDSGFSGSEVSIDPSGDVYPCCIKTAHPLGNLLEESLTDILHSFIGHPALEAINAGKPERMGLSYGWSVGKFLAASHTKKANGEDYANLCIGCDKFHREVLGDILETIRQQRLVNRHGLLASSGRA
jgi:hypothetical protein